MKLSINITPRQYTARTHSEIVSKISHGKVYTFTNQGDYLTPMTKGANTITVYNLQKVNKKTKQTKVKTKNPIPGGFPFETKSTVIRNGHWVAYVYDIPVELIKVMGVKVIQLTRNFKITKNK